MKRWKDDKYAQISLSYKDLLAVTLNLANIVLLWHPTRIDVLFLSSGTCCSAAHTHTQLWVVSRCISFYWMTTWGGGWSLSWGFCPSPPPPIDKRETHRLLVFMSAVWACVCVCVCCGLFVCASRKDQLSWVLESIELSIRSHPNDSVCRYTSSSSSSRQNSSLADF